MKKQLFFLCTFLCTVTFGQVQVGQTIFGNKLTESSKNIVSTNIDGTILAVVNADLVSIYKNINDSWQQIGSSIEGTSVNLNGDGTTVAITKAIKITETSRLKRNVASIYKNINNTWVQIGTDIRSKVGEIFIKSSMSLSSDGNSIAIGSDKGFISVNSSPPGPRGSFSGYVRVYKNINNNWLQIGDDITSREDVYGDNFGESVSLNNDGTILATGGTGDNGKKIYLGFVKVFKNINNSWVQVGEDIDGEIVDNNLGESVSLSADGNIVATGNTVNYKNKEFSGQVSIFKNINNSWQQVGDNINGEAALDRSGSSISLSADGITLAIGATKNDGINGEESGHVRIYKNINDTWVKVGEDIDGDTAGDELGYSVSLSKDGNFVVVNAPRYKNNNQESIGQVKVYSLASVLSSDSFVLSKFNMFPNPAKGQFTINLSEGLQLKKVHIFSQLGQLMQVATSSIIKTNNLPKGVYFIQILTNKGKATKKLIVE